MKTLFSLSFFVLISFLFMNCSSINEDTKLTANKWQLIEMKSQGKAIALPADNPISLELKDRATGNSGCNSYFSDYTVSGNKLTIKGIGQTEMACDDMAVETSYTFVLSGAQTYTIDAQGHLHIQCAAGELVYKAVA